VRSVPEQSRVASAARATSSTWTSVPLAPITAPRVRTDRPVRNAKTDTTSILMGSASVSSFSVGGWEDVLGGGWCFGG
jgi:hypothetical protein